MSKVFTVLMLLFFFSFSSFGQWNELSTQEINDLRIDNLKDFRAVRLNAASLLEAFERAPLEFTPAAKENAIHITIALPDGTNPTFSIQASPIMEDRLAQKFPAFKSFTAQNIHQKSMIGRLDWTNKGFHGFILSEQGTIYIDPLAEDIYISYYKKDRIPLENRTSFCGLNLEDQAIENFDTPINHRSPESVGENLRTLRLAVSATGEYTSYHGDATSALAAIVTTINRINLIYEVDLSVRFILVGNNDNLIFTDANSDPFNNGNAGSMLNVNTSVINSNIGAGNYDIGHVFATAGSGLAGLGVVCSNDKGEGVTGINPPEGTTFDVDYVSHEIGHQLEAFHTFNNCGGPGGTPTGYEPGSGSTIMAYAGLCGANNVQFSSNDYFHGVSLQQMNSFLNSGQGSCFEEVPTGNNPPEVSVLSGGFFIPSRTPFELTAEATDPEGDNLTYCWEQFNSGPVSALGSPSGSAPAFRSFAPTEDATRIFPKLGNVLNNITSSLEVLPTYSRSLNFNVVVRDNHPGGGGSAQADVTFQADGNSGPFKVTYPNALGIQWQGNNQVEITWDVAGTDQAPVNCSHVDIMLYTGTEFSFHSMLAVNTPNDGSEFITVPDENLVFSRIKIKAHDNIFFNVSNIQFLILADPAATSEPGDNNQLLAFPNPTQNQLNINLQNGEKMEAILLFNALGQQVYQENLTGLQTMRSINTQRFSDGIYFLKVQAGNKYYRKKILIKH